jgi:sulfate transport system permease protein
MATVSRRVLPGLGLSLGFTVAYLSLLVLLPLSACFLRATALSGEQLAATLASERVRSAFALTFGASLLAAAINVLLGLLLAWVLVRYDFPGKRLFDALIDLPFALPTAVAGLVYASLYVPDGWLGQLLVPLGIHAAYSRLGIVLVLVFTGLPFVVRTVQPVLEDLEQDVEEAGACLGATRGQVFWRIILPALRPALITGFALALARALGEYGSVVFIAGNFPRLTEIAPVLIVSYLEDLDHLAYHKATALAVVLLSCSFVLLGLINLLERWSKRHAV